MKVGRLECWDPQLETFQHRNIATRFFFMADVQNQVGQEGWCPVGTPGIVAISVMLATFMEVLDSTVVNVSLPHIAGNLGSTT